MAPGFIDIHSHDDWLAPLPDGPALLGANVQQGITTTVAGNCGLTPAPLGESHSLGAIERMLLVGYVTDRIGWSWRSVGEFFDVLEQRGLPLNLCMFVGHSTLRATVMGHLCERPATPGELAEMKRLLTEGLQQGAIGMSVGLEYHPGRYAGPSEVELLAEIVARHDGLTAVHTRGISGLYDRGMAEAIGFATASRCRLQISHVAPMGRSNWGEVDKLFGRVDEARAAGIDIGFDVVPYTTWTLAAPEVMPHPIQDLGADAILALTASDDGRRFLREKIESSPPSWPPWIDGRVTRNMVLDMGWDAMIVADPRSRTVRGETGRDRGGDGDRARPRPVRRVLRSRGVVGRKGAIRQRRLRRGPGGRRAAAARAGAAGCNSRDGHRARSRGERRRPRLIAALLRSDGALHRALLPRSRHRPARAGRCAHHERPGRAGAATATAGCYGPERSAT